MNRGTDLGGGAAVDRSCIIGIGAWNLCQLRIYFPGPDKNSVTSFRVTCIGRHQRHSNNQCTW